MKVYRGHRASKAHFNPDCPRRKLFKTKYPLQELDHTELKAVDYCHTCTPPEVWKRPRTLHLECSVCGYDRPMPCQHNGGVAVLNVDEAEWFGKPTRRVSTQWRWVENVQGATLAHRPSVL